VRDEKVVLAIYVTALVAVSLTAVFLVPTFLTSPGSIYADYRAVLFSNLTLVEEYTYYVGESGKTMLYRYWEAPLYATPSTSATSEPHIVALRVECPQISVPYVKDSKGVVHIYTSEPSYSIYVPEIRSKAYTSEAGCYFPGGIPLGSHIVRFVFQLNPPVHVDSKYAHLNIMLAESHVPYRQVEVVLAGLNPVRLYVHVPEYRVEGDEISMTIRGSSPRDTLLEVELVVPRDSLRVAPTYETPVSDVLSETDRANASYSLAYGAVKGAYYVFAVVLLAFPFLMVVRYSLVGAEKKFTVPEYLSYIPNPSRKPWHVNLLFYGDAIDIDENAFYATVLDLVKRGVVEIKEASKDDVVLEVKEGATAEDLDAYERRVVEFLREYSEGRVFSFRRFSEVVKRDVGVSRARAQYHLSRLSSLTATPREAYTYARQFIEPRKPIPVYAIVALLLVVAITVVLMPRGPEYYIYPAGATVFSILLVVEAAASYTMPSYVFGRWREDYYREKLEWGAFRNLLKDLAKLGRYAPQDLVIWREWLIYAAALGVADKVVEAMEKLNVPIPREAYVPIVFRPIFTNTLVTARAAVSGGGKGGRGGFGARGGFGGGGGGVR